MRLLGFLATALAVYAMLFYSVPPRGKKREPRTPTNHSLGEILRNFVFGIAALFAIDGAIFHTGFYQSLLKDDSYAGTVNVLFRSEKERATSSAGREIALLGDSRLFESFSAKMADSRAASKKIRFINLAAPGCPPRVWYYLLREIDPGADRYQAIVLPIRFANIDQGRADPDKTTDIRLAAPLLHYSDALVFARSFRKWPDKCHAFAACVLRGYAFRNDLEDLLANPVARLKQRPTDAAFLAGRYDYEGDSRSLAGVSFNPETQKLYLSEHLEAFRRTLESSLKPKKNRGVFDEYRDKWLGRILDRYRKSGTTIVLLQLPRGPFGGAAASLTSENSILDFVHNERTVVLDPHLFDHIERPEFFVDRHHLNSAGRELFTQRLTDELVGRFQSNEDGESRE